MRPNRLQVSVVGRVPVAVLWAREVTSIRVDFFPPSDERGVVCRVHPSVTVRGVAYSASPAACDLSPSYGWTEWWAVRRGMVGGRSGSCLVDS